MNKKILLILTGLAVFAFIVRSYLLPSHLFFGPEQGRDFLVIRDIVINHKLTLIGSKTDIDGIFHGPIFYYLGAIPFILSAGNPYVVLLFFIGMQSLTVFAVYFLSFDLTKNRRISLISAALYTFSFGAVIYSRWLSNPPLTIPLSVLFFICLIKFLRGNTKWLYGAAITYGLMGQAEFINFLLVAVTGACILLIFRTRLRTVPKITLFFSALVALFFSTFNFILFDIRHELLISGSLFELLRGSVRHSISYFQSWSSVSGAFVRSSMDILGLPNTVLTVIVLIVLCMIVVFESRKNRYVTLIFFWLIVPNVTLCLLGQGALIQLYVFLVVGLLIGMGYSLNYVFKLSPIVGTILFILIVFSNLYLWFSALPTNQRVFFQSTQPDLTYADQLGVLDYVYQKANGRQFFFQSYTIPYFWQDGWKYLFWRYAKVHNLQVPDEKDDALMYVIIQKDISNPRFQEDWYTKTVQTWGELHERAIFGTLTVEERVKNH